MSTRSDDEEEEERRKGRVDFGILAGFMLGTTETGLTLPSSQKDRPRKKTTRATATTRDVSSSQQSAAAVVRCHGDNSLNKNKTRILNI